MTEKDKRHVRYIAALEQVVALTFAGWFARRGSSTVTGAGFGTRRTGLSGHERWEHQQGAKSRRMGRR
jgi:hypothetical protein